MWQVRSFTKQGSGQARGGAWVEWGNPTITGESITIWSAAEKVGHKLPATQKYQDLKKRKSKKS